MTLETIALAFDDEAVMRTSNAISTARNRANEAIGLRKMSASDSKFQLKALAAKWHVEHKAGAVENCPLCDSTLKEIPAFA